MKYEGNVIQGWMSGEELEWLFQQAKKMELIVEIGCWKGRSTHALLSGCPGIVYAVDTWKGNPNELNSAHHEALEHDIYPIFLENVGHFKNLKAIRGYSVDVAEEFYDNSVDMVFIDGCHAYDDVLADIKAWLPKTTKLICGHDRGQDGVPAAIAEVFGEVGIAPGTIWFVELPFKNARVGNSA